MDNFISVAGGLPRVGSEVKITNLDKAFTDLGDYKNSTDADYIYPFLNLMTQTELLDKTWDIYEEGDYFVITGDISSFDISNYHLDENTVSLDAKVFLGKEIMEYQYDVSTVLEGEKIIVKNKGLEKMSDLILDFAKPLLDICDDNETIKKAISIAIIVWNISLLPEKHHEKAIKKISLDLSPHGDATDVATIMSYVDMLMKRKKEYFPNNNRAIINYHISDLKEGIHLDVASTLSP